MESVDELILQTASMKNCLESMAFETRGNLDDQKFKDCFPDQLKKKEYEEYLTSVSLWIENLSDNCDFENIKQKIEEFHKTSEALVPNYHKKFEQLEKEKAKLVAESIFSNLNSTHENTKKDSKPKTNKQKLDDAKEKKEMGNTHFVNIDYPSAVKRYTQAIESLKSMYDETPEQKTEGDTIKLACYLNVAQCLLKVNSLDKAIDNCKYALEIDEKNTKALFRRGTAYFLKKEYELAQSDLAKAADLQPGDKAIKNQLLKNENALKLQKEKEKKMYAKMFS